MSDRSSSTPRSLTLPARPFPCCGEILSCVRAVSQSAAALAVGGLLGWLVASGRYNPDRLTAAPPKADQKATDKLDRTTLPIPEPKRAFITELDARKTKAPPRFEVKAPREPPTCSSS